MTLLFGDRRIADHGDGKFGSGRAAWFPGVCDGNTGYCPEWLTGVILQQGYSMHTRVLRDRYRADRPDEKQTDE